MFLERHKSSQLVLVEILFMAAAGHAIFALLHISTLPELINGRLSFIIPTIYLSFIIMSASAAWGYSIYAAKRTYITHFFKLSGIIVNLLVMIFIFTEAEPSPLGSTITIFALVFIFQLSEALINGFMILLDDIT